MNNLELILLRLLLYNNNYILYNHLIDYKYIRDYSIELFYMYKSLEELHKINSNNLNIEELESYFYAKYTDANDKYKLLFDQLKQLDISSAVVEATLDELNKKKLALTLSEKAFGYTQGRANLEDLQSLFDQIYKPVIDTKPDEFVSTDLEFLVGDSVLRRGLRFRLNCLNKALGSVRQGDFGCMFARPETGKTTLLASETSFMLDQLPDDRPLIWANNEEQGNKVMLRICQAYFGIRMDQLLAGINKYKHEFMDRVGHKIKLVDSASIERGLIEDLCAKYNPGLVVFDQLDKVKGFKADRDDLVYGAIYQWGRELAKQYCPIISVCQADGTAEGNKYLYMNHMALAKTSKQAECDWILGIGKSHEPGGQFTRYLNISKNKLAGDDDSNPALRHGRFDVLIRPDIARYEDIIEYD